jgi:hypothetical protein
MKRKTMIGVCTHIRARLRELESMLGYLPIGEHGYVFQCIQEIQELAAIAKYETISRSTTEQARHLLDMGIRIRRLHQMLPQDTAEYPENDPD